MDKEKLQDKLKSLKGKEYLDKIKKSVDAKELLEKAKSVDGKEILDKIKSVDAKEYLDKVKNSVDAKELLEKAKSVDTKEYLDKIKSLKGKEYLDKIKSLDAKELLEKTKSVDGRKLLGKAKSLKKSKKKMILIAALCCLCVVGGVRWLMKDDYKPQFEAETAEQELAPELLKHLRAMLAAAGKGNSNKYIEIAKNSDYARERIKLSLEKYNDHSYATGEFISNSSDLVWILEYEEVLNKIFNTEYFKELTNKQKSQAHRKIFSDFTLGELKEVKKYDSWFGDKDMIAKTVYNFLDTPGGSIIHIVSEFSKEDEMLLLKLSRANSKNFDELFNHPKYEIPVQSGEYKEGKTLNTWKELDKEKKKNEEIRKRKLFETGAKNGDPWCLYGLSHFYFVGEAGLRSDAARAVELMSKAAELNVPDANRDLGRYYLDGWWGLQKDNKKGMELITKAAELEDPMSLNLLGVWYLNGRYDLPKDIQKGLLLIVKAAELNDLNACENLGELYEEGEHVEQNIQIAQAYFKKLKMLAKEAENDYWVKKATEQLHGLHHLPDLFVDPKQLIRDYEENKKAADKKYKGKTVRMNGEFKVVKKMFRDKYVILSVSEEQGLYVQCRFDKDRMRQLNKMFEGSSYYNTVQGVVTGKSWGDIQLEHCWFLGEVN